MAPGTVGDLCGHAMHEQCGVDVLARWLACNRTGSVCIAVPLRVCFSATFASSLNKLLRVPSSMSVRIGCFAELREQGAALSGFVQAGFGTIFAVPGAKRDCCVLNAVQAGHQFC